ncbi:FadR/GntR family transcriptional regulator [Dethiosulfatarculus sandiegensis]|uniref:FadR/GntR family transcriptional regulator n=1 Tax=Dethiosulfatarculus sandiegensis TaxID=1429043 RepID=UPI001E621218|nr:FadR/GntR family transcriptional regulator [Dethiosulfatarculus sandiegensis]
MTIQKIRRIPSLYEEVVDRIKKAIFAGEYRSGEVLPSEVEMAEQLGVSRPVVREAYKSLQSLGFLEIRRGTKGGAFVCDLDNLSFAENISDLIRLGKISIDNLVATRLFLEPEIGRLAATHATLEQLDGLAEIAQEYADVTNPRDQIRLNSKFHRFIGRACGNPLFSVLLDSIMDFTETFLESICPQNKVLHQPQEHMAIHAALCARDQDLARELVHKHISNISTRMHNLQNSYLKGFSEQESKQESEPEG